MMQKLNSIRIVHIVNSLETGGMENGVINICNNINRELFETSICCINGLGSMANRLDPSVHIVNMGFYRKNLIYYIFKLSKFFSNGGFDIVHAHGWGAGALLSVFAAKLAKVPVLINGEHGSFFTKKYQVYLQKKFYFLCDANLAVSNSLSDRVGDFLDIPKGKRSLVIRNGVDTGKFSGSYEKDQIFNKLEKDKFNIDRDAFNIFIVGSLKREKNQVLLINAVRNILLKSNNRTKINAIIVGDGSDRDYLENLVHEYGLAKNIYFLGNREDVAELLSIAHLLVSTSIGEHEGLSNVLLEAMSSYIPVIATRSVGTEEIVEHGINGYLIEENDLSSLVRYINTLISNPHLRQELGCHAHQYIVENFSIGKMVSEYECLYEKLIKNQFT